MKLDAAGREYITWPTTGVPSDAADLEFSFDLGVTWFPAEYNGDKTTARLLLAGPDITAVDGQVTLTVGRHPVTARLVDTPEVPVRTLSSVIDVIRQGA